MNMHLTQVPTLGHVVVLKLKVPISTLHIIADLHLTTFLSQDNSQERKLAWYEMLSRSYVVLWSP